MSIAYVIPILCIVFCIFIDYKFIDVDGVATKKESNEK